MARQSAPLCEAALWRNAAGDSKTVGIGTLVGNAEMCMIDNVSTLCNSLDQKQEQMKCEMHEQLRCITRLPTLLRADSSPPASPRSTANSSARMYSILLSWPMK
jgi:hypothetical protein